MANKCIVFSFRLIDSIVLKILRCIFSLHIELCSLNVNAMDYKSVSLLHIKNYFCGTPAYIGAGSGGGGGPPPPQKKKKTSHKKEEGERKQYNI